MSDSKCTNLPAEAECREELLVKGPTRKSQFMR